ncbi:MAG: hypothetical protein AAFN12_20115, partial [Cyanobacteria bacterium J06560_2]
MKSARSFIALCLTLLVGTGLGIALQRYLKVSSLLGDVGSASNTSEANAQQIGQPVISPRLQGRLKLYVLVGQSNMVGAAEI